MAKNGNKQLGKAKRAKEDEFYTRLEDIERELAHYKEHFRGKTVLCNCDDPRVSNFFHYFAYQFETLGLKRLITTCYKNQERDLFSRHDCEKAIWLEYFGDRNGNRVPDPEEIGIHELQGDGDFRSPECVELLKQADIVVTNPPFSLFGEYVTQLIQYGKKFIIIGPQNATHYKDVFSLIIANKLWLGYGFHAGNAYFKIPQDTVREFADGVYDSVSGLVKFRNCTWFTNLDIERRHEEQILFKHFTPEDYPTYENFDAIDVSRISDIPCDWTGMMGVPDTFLYKHNPDQFEIVGLGCGDLAKQIGVKKNHRGRTDVAFKVGEEYKCPYSRIIIRRRK